MITIFKCGSRLSLKQYYCNLLKLIDSKPKNNQLLCWLLVEVKQNYRQICVFLRKLNVAKYVIRNEFERIYLCNIQCVVVYENKQNWNSLCHIWVFCWNFLNFYFLYRFYLHIFHFIYGLSVLLFYLVFLSCLWLKQSTTYQKYIMRP